MRSYYYLQWYLIKIISFLLVSDNNTRALKIDSRGNRQLLWARTSLFRRQSNTASVNLDYRLLRRMSQNLTRYSRIFVFGETCRFKTDSLKMIYIGRLLFTVSMSLARLSILYFIGLLAVTEWVIKINQALIGIVAVWSVAALFAFAFQCQLPYPWDSEPGRCVNQVCNRLAVWDVWTNKPLTASIKLFWHHSWYHHWLPHICPPDLHYMERADRHESERHHCYCICNEATVSTSKPIQVHLPTRAQCLSSGDISNPCPEVSRQLAKIFR